MIEKVVKAYICEHCGKKQYAKGAMNTHEKHCTKNPDRKCRLCGLVEIATDGAKAIVNLSELVAVLKDQSAKPLARMATVRSLTDCPACILAAIRQSKILDEWKARENDVEGDFYEAYFGAEMPPMASFLRFDFQEEKRKILNAAREAERGPHY